MERRNSAIRKLESHRLPSTRGARPAGISCSAAAALFVRKAALAAPSSFEVIGKAFKLTPTELRVLPAVVDVGGVPQVAEPSELRTQRSGRISAACLKRPARRGRRIS
jgi:hypothetical protein